MNIHETYIQQESSYDAEKDMKQGLALLKIESPVDNVMNILKAVKDKAFYCKEYKCESLFYSRLFEAIGYEKTIEYLEKRYDCMMNLNAFQYVLQEYAEIHIPNDMAQLAIDEDGGEIGIKLVEEFNRGFLLKEEITL